MSEQYQSVWITFANGKIAGFCGKAVVFEGKENELGGVIDVKFTRPKPLPDGASFEAITKDDL